MPNGKVWDDKGGDIGSLSTDVLKSILHADLNSETSERLSPETVKYIVKLLRKREEEAGQYETVDVTAAWERFQTDHLFLPDESTVTENESEDSEKEKSHKIGLTSNNIQPIRRRLTAFRRLIAIVAAIGLLLATMLVAQAAGIDVFGAIGRWTDETFQFVISPKRMGAAQEDVNMPHTSENYASLVAALNDCGITEVLAPTWFPEEFELSEQKVINEDSRDTIYYRFSGSGQKIFTIQIMRVNSASDIEAYVFEKDDTSVEQYISGGKTFYLLSNLDNQTATWSDGHSIAMIILGNISEDDIKTMIDSIGGPQS